MDAEIFPEGGGKTTNVQKVDHFFGAPQAQTKILAFFSRRFRPILSDHIASAEGASEKFMHICTDTAWPDFCLIVTLTMWF